MLNTRDVSERKAFEEQLAHQAFHDAVTGLANRALFKDRVEHMLERQARDNLPVSVLFMDLDDFKTINDSLGHAAGDRMLGRGRRAAEELCSGRRTPPPGWAATSSRSCWRTAGTASTPPRSRRGS